MIICCCWFSENGKKLYKKLNNSFSEITWIERNEEKNISEWINEIFLKRLPIIFIGAIGIAVRLISRFVKNKFEDSPVLVMDEKGEYIIPILSGHIGGANEIANLIASKFNCKSIITTATDLENKFAVDIFAKKNKLKIMNHDGIKKISTKILNNERIKIWISPEIKYEKQNIPEQLEIMDANSRQADICIAENKSIENCLLHLKPKKYFLGIGCKKGKSFEEINRFVLSNIDKNILSEIGEVSSIDLKKNEIGLLIFAQYYNIPFFVYSADELERAILMTDEFSKSDFVKKITGVSNVCERAAICSAGKNGKLIIRKISGDGITLAVAEGEIKIKW